MLVFFQQEVLLNLTINRLPVEYTMSTHVAMSLPYVGGQTRGCQVQSQYT